RRAIDRREQRRGGLLRMKLATCVLSAAITGAAVCGSTLCNVRLQADAAKVDPDGTTPLHWAVRADDIGAVKRLLLDGANAKATNRYGVTPLALAAESGDAAMIDVLIAAGADARASLSNGQTMLMIASRTGSPAAIRTLVAHGALLNAKENVLGETALIWAAADNHADAIAALVQAGADVDLRSNELKFSRRDYGDGKSGRFTVLPRGGWTPLMYAARQDAREAIRALAAAHANLNATDPDGTTPLAFAIINAHYDAAALLLDLGADPNVADSRGMTPLYAAVDMHTLDETPGRPAPKPTDALDSLGMMERLLAKGANPNARLTATILERVHNNGDPVLSEGATPLMRAARKADAAAMRILLEHGADTSAVMKGGVTAVMIASGFGGQVRFAEYNPHSGTESDAADCVRLSLTHGADINAANDAGQTALHIAAAQRGEAFIRFLAANGARLDAKDKQGHTPLDVAMGIGGGRGRGRSPGAREPIAALLRELASK
ncbi:MAG TPA: ankyrin repeat domain-containing protein, partial [Vicinamibacterales bacterium]|nr:ankyrin repeat domain-containing protein [Vicinamibacterales bacterium]